MFGRLMVSLALVATLIVASARATSPACVLVNVPSHKACASACCANKSCCQTSSKRTGESTQPLATVGSNQQNLVALEPLISSGSADQLRATEIPGFSIAKISWHSPETLALLCIRLI